MKIAICDDEKNIRELIGNKVQRIDPKADICFFSSGDELLVSEERIDVLFLDIQMQGRNGMETARELRKKDKDVILIFVTAIEDFVFQAFDVEAFHYLVKPIDDNKFAEVLKKAVEQRLSKRTNNGVSSDKYLVINHGGLHSKVLIDDIVYAEVFNRKVVIHKIDADIEYYGKMTELEGMVGEHFFRTHRSYLVNFKYVEKYDVAIIYLEKGMALMAKQKYSEFIKKYMKYSQRR
ncbi:MAG: LytTR family DNA-binding domain-containing protein [Lachnospiraceae bacterium]|nr:LytTR family DNA-binding domain-containing protein [Lachnospiraceae bacterium]